MWTLASASWPTRSTPASMVEVRDVEDSKALAGIHAPSIIVSASGMATGGRVVHHLSRLLPGHRNTVLLVGFQAPGTRGRLLADGADEIKMLGRYVRVRAEVVELGGFSVHADREELVRWLHTADRPPESTYLVHGEAGALASLRDRIREQAGWDAFVARDGERVRVD
jgi:metallo-beta-lactamase family protein